MIEDLGSRNGTFVGGVKIDQPTGLDDPAEISVAGFSIQFTHRIDIPAVAADESVSATDDQLTMEFDPAGITDKRKRSRYLENEPAADTSGAMQLTSRRLLQLAFELARADGFDAIVDATLDTIDAHISFDSAGVYAVSNAKADVPGLGLPLSGTRQHGTRSYRRPPESLITMVCDESGEATLARNVIGDSALATKNSRGEIEVESLILAPVRDSDGLLRGLIHVTTTSHQTPLTSESLEFVVATAQILAESLRSLHERRDLRKSLHRSRKKVQLLQQQIGEKVKLIGRSQGLVDVVEKIKLAAPTTATVLVSGESGVGKELVAAAIHHASSRSEGPLICLNCAALSPTLLESELFGHEKGAFTGATDRKIGKFEAADSGTLMLDEIGEMNADIQAKFLRVLEGHAFERVGGHQSIKVDVRVVAATNRDLQSMVAEGTFRQDLYYRLNVVEIVVPPLRKRLDDVMPLADFFLHRFRSETGRKIEGFTDAARRSLMDYSWPGNVRELKNVIERAVVLNTHNVIDQTDLTLSLTTLASADANVISPANGEIDVNQTLADIEQFHIQRVLRHTEGNKSQAAKILGIERSTLDRKLKRWAKS